MKKKPKKPATRPRSTAMTHRRNAASAREIASRAGRAVVGAARATRQKLEEPNPHAWQDVLATVLAGGGSALLGGYAVRKGIDPKIVSTAMLVGGSAAAFGFTGTLRTAATSIAGAGAGQLALTIMQERAIEELKAAMASAAKAEPKRSNALPAGSFEDRLALHSQLAEDAARFTEPEPDVDHSYAYADAAA